jgi:hypothetical protein
MTIGSRVKGAAGAIDYRAEAGIQFGSTPVTPSFAAPEPDARDKFAYQVDAEVGVGGGGFRAGLEGAIASGDDPDTADKNEGYNDLYPTGHKFLGYSDVMGARTNVASGVLHLSYKPSDSVAINLDAHHFSRLQEVGGEKGAVGQEIDTQLLWKIGGGASLRGMYAMFLPAEDYWTGKAEADKESDLIHYFELQFGYGFK